MLKSINPANGLLLTTLETHSEAQVEAAVAAAARAQADWRRRPQSERAALLGRMAAVLRTGKDHYARLITQEMGKPIGESLGEIEKCAWNCEFYSENAARFLAPEIVETPARESFVSYEPLGVVLGVMPWNYPFWQVFRCLAPIIAAGNGYLLKHASNVPQCATAIAEIMREADTPEGLFATLLVGADKVERLIAAPQIAAVTLTGSTEVGRLVAAQAGRHIKKQVLELGGSDPFIVLADADLDKAVETALKARFHNAGQSCISPKRFIVEAAVADAFTEAFVAGVDALTVGDPLDTAVQMGPMARPGLRDELDGLVKKTVAEGARPLRGGDALPGEGSFYAPTVLDGVAPGMTTFTCEAFGPVASIVRAPDAGTAIAMANDTEFGLSASLWSQDLDRARKYAAEIDAGAVFVNALVASDPRMPFGGIKQSGYGRELAIHGIREFTNAKSVWIG